MLVTTHWCPSLLFAASMGAVEGPASLLELGWAGEQLDAASRLLFWSKALPQGLRVGRMGQGRFCMGTCSAFRPQSVRATKGCWQD